MAGRAVTVRAARRALTVRGARMLGGTTAPANGRRGAGLAACCQEDLFHYNLQYELYAFPDRA